MSFAITYSRANCGIQALAVTVEIHIAGGLPRISIVGLPETAVKESKDRVRSALLNMKFNFPPSRLTINLAPADLPKEGGRFDLAMAIGILVATDQLHCTDLEHYEFAGELALSGKLRPIKGALPFALATRKQKKTLIITADNAKEAALVKGLTILPATHFLDVCAHLCGKKSLSPFNLPPMISSPSSSVDLSQLSGQPQARRALEIAAAGNHSMLMMGPPGTGKTLLANCLTTILPIMTETEALASAMVMSISTQHFHYNTWRQRPFRSPHHSASSAALVGGGSPPKPGEISLAHHGVLFLDELPEFNRSVLEALRQPLESGTISISRAAQQAEFPARFQLIAAMNPCPCGYFGDQEIACRCSPEQINRYQYKISGPILDRIDLHIQVPRLSPILLLQTDTQAESSQTVRQRVEQARAIQQQRNGTTNAQLNQQNVLRICQLTPASQTAIEKIIPALHLSVRSYYRILKIARTIADLANEDAIHPAHLHEAINYYQFPMHCHINA